MEPYYEPDSEFREPLTDVDAFLDSARYNEEGDLELLKAYLEQNPTDVDSRDEQGRTAVHMAAANGHMPILEMLFRFHPKPNVPNDEGNTALHFAALNNRVAAAEALLMHGWRSAEQNVMGKTALQLIYDKQFNEMEALLVGRDETLDTYIPPTAASVSVDLPTEGDEGHRDVPETEMTVAPPPPRTSSLAAANSVSPAANSSTGGGSAKRESAVVEPVRDATTSTEMLGSAAVDEIV